MDYRIITSRDGVIFDQGGLDHVVAEEIRAYLLKASSDLEAEVGKRIPVVSGITRGALFSAVRGVTAQRGEAVVSLPVEHADALEYGSKPHWPPYDPTSKTFPQIQLWVTQRFREKGGTIRAAVQGIRQSRRISQASAIRSLAFLVARKIARRGTKALKMFQLAQQELGPYLTEGLWDVTLNKIAKRLNEGPRKTA